MRVFKTRVFKRWADAEGFGDQALCQAVREIEQGLYEAALGSGLIKKRVALAGHGKRGGARTLVAHRRGDRAAFLFGFRKAERETIDPEELTTLRVIAKGFLAWSEPDLDRALRAQEFSEVECEASEAQPNP